MPETKELSEKLLIRELKNHNEKAFRTLFDFYSQDIYRFSFSILKSKELAEENVQEVFLKVWLYRENLNLDQSFKSYLFTIARNQAFNFLNKVANETTLKEELSYTSQKSYDQGDFSLRELDCKRLKKQALKQLPPKRKQIFKMSRKQGKTYEEISQELGISINTVKNQMGKALETLRLFFQIDDGIL